MDKWESHCQRMTFSRYDMQRKPVQIWFWAMTDKCKKLMVWAKNFWEHPCNELGVNVFRSLVETKVKTENHLSAFEVVGVVNTEILKWVSLNFLFTNKLVNLNNLTFCFLGTFFWVPTLVNRHEICSGYGPALTCFIGNQQKKKKSGCGLETKFWPN